MVRPHRSRRFGKAALTAAASAFLLGSRLVGQTPTLLHTFNGTDGAGPVFSLTRGNDGVLYGITITGGTSSCNGDQCGTIYKLDTLGNFLTIYDFPQSANDAFRPLDGLTLGVDGFFYGTTLAGGTPPASFGTVYRFDPAGGVTVLHGFDITDGYNVIGGVVQANTGTLYGTTSSGGSSADPHCNVSACGTLFSLDSALSLVTLHSFNWTDGALPQTTLTFGADGNLYGTALRGGMTAAICDAGGCGTVFRSDVAGNVTPLHVFTGGADGWGPTSALIKANDGNLYGTTVGGGDTVTCGIGCGTVYKIDGSGAFSTVHTFHSTDGRIVVAGVIQATDGDFYGTTEYGGANDVGTIYEMDAAGNVTTLYSFDGTVGQYPLAGLVQASDGNFYGGASLGASGRGVLYRFPHLCYKDIGVPGPGNPVYPYICTLGVRQITGGCGGGDYCPVDSVTREQMAVFLLKAMHGPAYVPPPCTGIFSDVSCPQDFAVNWIEELYAEGITGGCQPIGQPPAYCPSNPVTRAQMAVFLLKAEHGSSYGPPACTGVFSDVTCPSGFANWIERLYAENVTGGCDVAPLRYCPANDNTRSQMAVFLVKTFGLM